MAKFGIEIECFNIPTIPQEIIDLGWEEKDDGSINGPHSAEIVSPPLVASNDSYKQVKRVLQLIREAGGQVNRSCGMHVHVEVEREVINSCHHGKFFEILLSRYNHLESYFDTLVPPSRRNNENSYCQSLSRFFTTDANQRTFTSRSWIRQNIFSQENVHNMEYHLEDFDRYHKVNLASYVRHGTVEFRHFGGTLNGTKAVAWIRVCIAMMEASKRASKRTNPYLMTPDEWNNPYFLVDSRRSIEYLTNRHNAAIRPAVVATEATV